MVREIHSLMGEYHNHSSSFFPNYSKLIHQDPIFTTENDDHQLLDIPFPSPFPTQTQQHQSSDSNNSSSHSHDDAEIFSDIALNYINLMLNEEDESFYDYSPALQAAEKPFYDILGKKYPPSPVYPPPESNNTSSSSGTPDSISPNYGNSISSTNSGSGSGSGSGGSWPYEYSESQLPIEFTTQSSFGSEFTTQSSFGSVSASDNNFDGFFDPNQFLEIMPAWQFHRGVEEARKFLPSNDKLVIDLEMTANQGSPAAAASASVTNEVVENVKVKSEEKEESSNLDSGFEGLSRGRKNPYSGDDYSVLEEGKRSVKQSAIATEDTLRTRELDEVLLCHDVIPKVISDIREALQHVINSKNTSGNGHGKGRGKKQAKKEVIDLRTLLLHCAQMVAADDQRSTNELLKQIRQHSSPTGDGSQRLAYYFANGIEARLAGTGSELYNSHRIMQRTATDYLKAYQLYLAACPFKKISYFFSNQMILNVSKNASRVHVVDFGISFGFQWPSLLQRLHAMPGPPKLRITGIDLPEPGFRPAKRIEETGRRLAEYAKGFEVPFEYKAIAAKWEEVRIEDLDIQEGEVLIVNCLYQLRYLADETVVVDSPRNMVLNTIRKMNPDLFIHGIVNGSYSAPFFVTRFREALFHFSALYDMLETIVPREDDQRMLIEREIFGREALNVIACEGVERTERPEMYKQWQVRNIRSGFVQHPLCKDILKKARDKVEFYHKDFCVDEDSRWLLQGWKGRIVYALSSWKPNNS